MNESQNYLLMLASDFTKIYASTHENYVFTRGLLSSISKIPVHLCWGIFQLLNYVIFFLNFKFNDWKPPQYRGFCPALQCSVIDNSFKHIIFNVCSKRIIQSLGFPSANHYWLFTYFIVEETLSYIQRFERLNCIFSW